jgi:hypothetical protein
MAEVILIFLRFPLSLPCEAYHVGRECGYNPMSKHFFPTKVMLHASEGRIEFQKQKILRFFDWQRGSQNHFATVVAKSAT